MNDYIHQINRGEEQKIQRFLRGLVWGVLGFVGLIVALYWTADSWLLMISPESEKRFIEPYVELAEDNFLDSSDAELEAYVVALTHDLARQMDMPEGLELQVRLVEGEDANAVTTLGGYIYVTESLLKVLDNENSLAMVLAHEIAHASERHPLLGTGRGMLVALVISVLSGSNPAPAAASDLGSQLMLYSYGREQEEQADHIALAALQSHYGHVGGATALFEYFAVSERADDESSPEESVQSWSEDELENISQTTELFSTHPNMTRRIEYIRAAALDEGWQQLEVTPYPAAVAERIKKL